ncbi:MAG: hypothetical protein U1F67_22255 [Rubrivivax sp.]
MHEIAVGQAAVGSINRQVDPQLRVRTTTTPGRSYRTCWQNTTGRGSGTVSLSEQCARGQELDVRNEYSRTETVSGTTSLWRIDTAALTRPARVLLLVRGRGFRPQAVLFIDAAERSLESSPSLALAGAATTSTRWAASSISTRRGATCWRCSRGSRAMRTSWSRCGS